MLKNITLKLKELTSKEDSQIIINSDYSLEM
jgi:hypothetical protein